MDLYTKFLWALSAWALLEGCFVLTFPALSIRLSESLFPKWADYLKAIPQNDFRKMGAIELGFGLFMGSFLLLFT